MAISLCAVRVEKNKSVSTISVNAPWGRSAFASIRALPVSTMFRTVPCQLSLMRDTHATTEFVQFLLLVHFIKPSDRKNSVRSFRTMSDDVCSWRRAAFANAARIDFAGSRCPRFRHTLKRFGSFARHDLAKLIFVSDKV